MKVSEGHPMPETTRLRRLAAVNMPDEYAQRLRPFNGCSRAARNLRDDAWSRLEQ